MSDVPLQRLAAELLRFRKDADLGQPCMREVVSAMATLEGALERLPTDMVAVVRGRRIVRRSATQLRRQIYYLNIKNRTLQQRMERLRGEHRRFLSSNWTVHAGLSDPRSSQRSVESWCRAIPQVVDGR